MSTAICKQAKVLDPLLWLLLLVTVGSSEGGATYDDVRRLHDWLGKFSPLIRPVHNQSDVTVVSVWINITLIHDLDIVKQYFEISGYFTLTWNAEKTRWNPRDFGGTTKFIIPASAIWKPDVFIHNTYSGAAALSCLDTIQETFAFNATLHRSLEKALLYRRDVGPRCVSEQSPFRDSGEFATLYHDGHVLWEPPFTASIACTMDIRNFPFDSQTCFIQLYCWSQSAEAVYLRAALPELFRNALYFNMKYFVQGVDVEELSFMFEHGYREPRLYSNVQYTLRFWRRPWIHVLSTLLPLVLLALLAACSFLMPPDSGDKLSLAVTALLSFTIFLEIINADLPSASDKMPYLVIYVTTMQAMGFVAVAGNMVIVRLYQLGEKRDAQRWNLPEEDSSEALSLLPPRILGAAPRGQGVTLDPPKGPTVIDQGKNLGGCDDDLQSTTSPNCIDQGVFSKDSGPRQLIRKATGVEINSQASTEYGVSVHDSDPTPRERKRIRQCGFQRPDRFSVKANPIFDTPDRSPQEHAQCLHGCCQPFTDDRPCKNRGLTSERLSPCLIGSEYDYNRRIQNIEQTDQNREKLGKATRGRGQFGDGQHSVGDGRGAPGQRGEGGIRLCLLMEAWKRRDLKQVARILNRMLFVLFVLVLVFASIALLVALMT